MQKNFTPGYGVAVGSQTQDNLIGAADVDIVTLPIVVASGQGVLNRGTLLGKVTSSGKYVISLNAAADGSQVPYGILAEDIDATSADVTTVQYISGAFNWSYMTFGAGQTKANTFDTLRQSGVILQDSVAY